MPDSLYYLAGGTLPVDTRSYVEREADALLFRGLLRGEFCYVLTSRQMGKSSLMVRTAERLRAEGAGAVVLDLNAVGHDLTREQWYHSLLRQIGRQLKVQHEVQALWEQTADLSPLQRWMETVRHIMLRLHAGSLVIFIDEIDQVRLLPFDVDEFFAGIRSFYSLRAEEPEFARLTFCLLGVALPSDLIADARITPFNVGRRIELTDFTAEQTLALAAGLGRDELVAQAILDRVFFWTNGHPYLTQRLCRAIAESPDVNLAPEIDTLCDHLFLSSDAQEQDDNLIFVRDRLLDSGEDISSLLSIYGRVRRGRSVTRRTAGRLADVLLLSGIVRADGEKLRVRNWIYGQVFDPAWIKAHMPDAELRRQRAAMWRGRLQAGAIAVAMALLAVFGFAQARQARNAADVARKAQRAATALAAERDAALKEANRQAYRATIQIIDREYERGDYSHVTALLARTQDSESRDVEWDYYHRQMNLQTAIYAPRSLESNRPAGPVSACFSPDGRQVLAACGDRTARVVDIDTGKERLVLPVNRVGVLCGAYSARGDKIVTAGLDGIATIWDAGTGRMLRTLRGHSNQVFGAAFSPDGTRVVTASLDTTARIWSVATGGTLRVLRGPRAYLISATFSPDGRQVLTSGFDNCARIWDAATGRQIRVLKGHTSYVHPAVYSPDGRYVATASDDKRAALWSAATGKRLSWLPHPDLVTSAAFSPDGSRLATGCGDGVTRIWDRQSLRLVATLRGHTGKVRSVAYSPDGLRLVTASEDGSCRVWDTAPRDTATLIEQIGPVRDVSFSPDGAWAAAAGDDGKARVWDAANGRLVALLDGHAGRVNTVRFSPDGRALLTACDDGTARQWNWMAATPLRRLIGHTKRVTSADYSPDGRSVITTSYDLTARIWDPATGRQTRLYDPNPTNGGYAIVRSAAYSPDGRRFVSVGADRAACVRNARTGQKVCDLVGHSGVDINRAAFSPDGRLIVTAADDHTARVWDAATGRPLVVLSGHADIVTSAEFLPNGRRVVTASLDGTARLWDAATGDELATLRAPGTGTYRAAASPDGRRILTAGEDGSVRLWFLGPDHFDWSAYRKAHAPPPTDRTDAPTAVAPPTP